MQTLVRFTLSYCVTIIVVRVAIIVYSDLYDPHYNNISANIDHEFSKHIDAFVTVLIELPILVGLRYFSPQPILLSSSQK